MASPGHADACPRAAGAGPAVPRMACVGLGMAWLTASAGAALVPCCVRDQTTVTEASTMAATATFSVVLDARIAAHGCEGVSCSCPSNSSGASSIFSSAPSSLPCGAAYLWGFSCRFTICCTIKGGSKLTRCLVPFRGIPPAISQTPMGGGGFGCGWMMTSWWARLSGGRSFALPDACMPPLYIFRTSYIGASVRDSGFAKYRIGGPPLFIGGLFSREASLDPFPHGRTYAVD